MDFSRLIPRILPGALLLLVFEACEKGSYGPPEPALIPVRSELVTPGPFQPTLPLLGRIEPAAEVEIRAAERGQVWYPARFSGGLRTGESVSRGELLFEIENDDIRLDLVEAELTVRGAETERDRARRSFEAGLVSQADLDQAEIVAESAQEKLEGARRRSARLKVTAPLSGLLRVFEKVSAGSEISPERVLAIIAGEGMPLIEAWAAGGDLQQLATGLKIRCLKPGTGQLLGHGELREVARQVDVTGTARLVIKVIEDLDLPPPGEGVDLEVLLGAKDQAISLPLEAVIVDGGATSAYVLETSGVALKARRRLLLTGSRSGGRIEVIDGLTAGERVAIAGAELLADGLLATEADSTEGI